MRLLLVLVISISSVALKAQTLLPINYVDYSQRQALAQNNFHDSASNKKWSLNKFGGISTSFSFFRGGNATVVSAPIGLQLTRKLNNNLYAFAAVSVAPVYVNFNRSFLSSDVNKGFQNNNFYQSHGLDMYSRAELGLMYISDNKAFSISGSISVERSSYPMFPVNQINNTKQNAFRAPN
jgi:hypothetical protein